MHGLLQIYLYLVVNAIFQVVQFCVVKVQTCFEISNTILGKICITVNILLN